MGEFRKGGKSLAAAVVGVACGASPLPFNVLPSSFQDEPDERERGGDS